MVHTGFVYTMCVTHEAMEQKKYSEALKHMEDYATFVFSQEPRVQYVNSTHQFKDYSKYVMEYYTEEQHRKYREAHFPIDCENARELSKALVNDVKAESMK